MLSRLVIAFLPRIKRLLISWLQSPSAVILEPKEIKSLQVVEVGRMLSGVPFIRTLTPFLLILFMRFSRQECWGGLPFASPVDHVLSELFTMTRPSWVALHGMAHSFIELDKSVIHMISLVSFLWLWFSFFGSDHELLIAKFRLKLKKVGKPTRPIRYDLNQIPYSGSDK